MRTSELIRHTPQRRFDAQKTAKNTLEAVGKARHGGGARTARRELEGRRGGNYAARFASQPTHLNVNNPIAIAVVVVSSLNTKTVPSPSLLSHSCKR